MAKLKFWQAKTIPIGINRLNQWKESKTYVQHGLDSPWLADYPPTFCFAGRTGGEWKLFSLTVWCDARGLFPGSCFGLSRDKWVWGLSCRRHEALRSTCAGLAFTLCLVGLVEWGRSCVLTPDIQCMQPSDGCILLIAPVEALNSFMWNEGWGFCFSISYSEAMLETDCYKASIDGRNDYSVQPTLSVYCRYHASIVYLCQSLMQLLRFAALQISAFWMKQNKSSIIQLPICDNEQRSIADRASQQRGSRDDWVT